MNYKHLSSNGQFATKRASKSSGIGVIYFILFVVFAICLYGYGSSYVSKNKNQQKNLQVITSVVSKEDRLDKAIEKLKLEVVEKLKAGESMGITFGDGSFKPTFDPPQSLKAKCSRIGGVMEKECNSYGYYMMKIGTIQGWQKVLGDRVMTDMEAINLAFDEKKSTEFVTRVIFKVPSSIWKWSYATQNRVWFDEHISTIRTLESFK